MSNRKPPKPPVKEEANDQTSKEPGKENAELEQIEARKDAELARNEPQGQEPPVEPGNPDSEPRHMAVADSVTSEAEREAARVQAENAGQVKNAFIAETRRETLDTFRPNRAEDVRVLVESNDHLDRSGDLVRESETKIVMSDGADEARMIDVQPEGVVEDEFDLGNGIKQTNLK